MIIYGDIIEKRVRVAVRKMDIENTTVKGSVVVNKDNRLTEGQFTIEENTAVIGSFNFYLNGDGYQMNLGDFAMGLGDRKSVV